MPRLLKRSLLGVCLVAAVAPVPAVASSAEFGARASNGYRIEVSASGRKVRLTAGGPAGTAIYKVTGRVSQRRVVANFGRLGMVDVVFRPGGRARIETPPNRCEGKPRATRWGAFVGTISFKGERGYTRLRIHRAAGRTRTSPRWRCKPRRRGARASATEKSEEPVIFELSDRRRGLEAGAFTLDLGEGDRLTAFIATQRERRGRMRIARTAIEITNGKGFVVDESLSEATIAPPPPFAGKGVFERRKGRDSWTGSLSVVLPGTPRISLTGRRFHPRLFRLSEDGIAKPGA